jgi:hypothetical protein
MPSRRAFQVPPLLLMLMNMRVALKDMDLPTSMEQRGRGLAIT